MNTPSRAWGLLLLLGFSSVAVAAEEAPPPRLTVNLEIYKTTKNLIPADPKLFRLDSKNAVAGYLGLEIGSDAKQRALVTDVAADSPAEKAGLRTGDVVLKVRDTVASNANAARELLRSCFANEALALGISREGKPLLINVIPVPFSKPLGGGAAQPRAIIGIQSGEVRNGAIEVAGVTPGGAGEKAGLRAGDLILLIDGKPLSGDRSIREVLSDRKPDDVVTIFFKRGKLEVETAVKLQLDPTSAGGARVTGWDDRLPSVWKKPTYKLAIIGIEYPDVKHNSKVKDSDWEMSLFSQGKYFDRSATGQRAYGSMNDYFQEISYGKFAVEGKFLGWTEVSKKRTEYSTGNGTNTREKTSLLTEALDKYIGKNGRDSLKEFEGVFFLYAGGRVQTTRGGLYWPHRASVSHQGKRWPYFIVQEGGENMTDISVFCHEFGHMLGLPDLYARPEVPGMEGVGVWCAMSQQNGSGRPQHFSAWPKEQLGWVKPIVIDPRVKQKIVLSPIVDSPTEVLKVLIKPDGSEYLLIENRQKKKYDSVLPAEGLLIWRVMPGRGAQPVYLEEAHGVTGPTGPREFPSAVPFPAVSNSSFTPFTTPSSKSLLGGGLDVYITHIKKWPDGRITFSIGYEYQ